MKSKNLLFFRKGLVSFILVAAFVCTGCGNQLVSGSLRNADSDLNGEKGNPKEVPIPTDEGLTASAQPSGQNISPASFDCTESDPAASDDPSSNGYASPEETEELLQDILNHLDSYDDSLGE